MKNISRFTRIAARVYFLTQCRMRRIDRYVTRLAVQVKDIEDELALPSLEQKQFAIAFSVSIGVAAIAGGIAYRFIYKEEAKELAEYLSYVFASLAAVYVGLGLFLGHERRWFWVSAALVVIGLAAFISARGPSDAVIQLFIAIDGICASFALLPVYISRTAKVKATWQYKAKLLLMYAACVLGYVAGLWVIIHTLRVPRAQVASKEMHCREHGFDAVSHALIVWCDTTSEEKKGPKSYQ